MVISIPQHFFLVSGEKQNISDPQSPLLGPDPPFRIQSACACTQLSVRIATTISKLHQMDTEAFPTHFCVLTKYLPALKARLP